MRIRSCFGTFIIVGLALTLLVLLALIAFRLEPVNRRMEGLSFRAQTFINQYRPKPVLPTPPPADIDTQALLQSRTTDSPAYFDSVLNENDTAAAGQNQAQAGSGVQLVESSNTQVIPVVPEIVLAGFNHEWQTWNNCGPATVSMNLSYFGQPDTQVDAAQFLKPNKNDKNVSTTELLDYARTKGYDGLVGQGGNTTQLKQLLSNGLPVIVEFWTEHEDAGGMGHYRLLTGFNQAENVFIAQDSLHGSGIKVPIDGFDNDWQVFNRTFVLAYPPDKSGVAHAILNSTGDQRAMLEQALLTAQAEATANPNNAFAWFNIGTNFARLGDPVLAAAAFDQARRLGLPYRMFWYQFDIFESYLATQRYQEVIDLTSATLEATGGLEELYYYRGLAHQALGQNQAAQEDFQSALSYNPNFQLVAGQ